VGKVFEFPVRVYRLLSAVNVLGFPDDGDVARSSDVPILLDTLILRRPFMQKISHKRGSLWATYRQTAKSAGLSGTRNPSGAAPG
jgi:hypothetical protein